MPATVIEARATACRLGLHDDCLWLLALLRSLPITLFGATDTAIVILERTGIALMHAAIIVARATVFRSWFWCWVFLALIWSLPIALLWTAHTAIIILERTGVAMMHATIIEARATACCLGVHILDILKVRATDVSLRLPGIEGLLTSLGSICLRARRHVVHAKGAIRLIVWRAATTSRAARQID